MTIVNNHQTNIQNITQGNNRANNMGEGLESYIKDVFANTLNETNMQKKLVQQLLNKYKFKSPIFRDLDKYYFVLI